MRIVSLLPSATEIVCALGLEDELVGVSHDCDWPPGLRDRKVVLSEAAVHNDLLSAQIDQTVKQLIHSGLSVYHLDAEALRRLKPDLILTQELCEVCAPSFTEVQRAARILDTAPKIVSLEPTCLDEILGSILLVGELTDREERARELVAKLRARIERVRSRTEPLEKIPRVLALEWLAPLYVAGHWVPEMIELAGGESLGPPGEPSYEIAWIDVENFDPQVIVLMPCGFSPERTRKEIDLLTGYEGWEELRAVKNGDVYLVHGSHYFNRPGPRIVVGLEILAKVLHSELFEDVEIPKGSMYPLHEGSYDEDLHTNGRQG